MCGINGFIQFSGKFDQQSMYNTVHMMNEKIIHRGPNHEGVFVDDYCALGMRRLSIIDLQGGNQPIWNETHDKLIVFNGELYNYRSLRMVLQRKGHVFSTDSDTEVMLHGYEEYGIEFLRQTEGMFAFAIYDLIRKQWILARDRIGEKPFYYYFNKQYFLFASELKSLMITGLVPKVIDRNAMSQFFQMTYISAPKSIFENVYKLMPASVMVIDDKGKADITKYWCLDMYCEESEYSDYDLCKKKLRDTLFRSVEKRMISDVPIGAFLSGGFDSSIIVGIMSQISSTPINTFTIGFPKKSYDESPLARLVAEMNRTNHREILLDWDEVVQDLDSILNNIDEPFADSSLIATYAVSKQTRKYATVALTGDAGDELFAGYDKYLIAYYTRKYKRIPKFLRKGLIEPISFLLPTESNVSRKIKKVINATEKDIYEQRKYMMCLGFKEKEAEQLMIDGYVDKMDYIRKYYEALDGADEQTRAQYVDLNMVLEGDMLTKVDRASMLCSLETRTPMLDKEVVELAFRIPTKFKISGKERKIILKDAFRDLLPKELFHAPKHGFSVPIGAWLEDQLKDQLYKYADREYLEEQGIFNAEYINKIIRAHMMHVENRYSEIWTFFVFQNWYTRMFA